VPLEISIGAGFVGFIHSLSPAHWLPVALIARTRNWSTAQTAFGAFVAASGHIIVSIVLGLVGIGVEMHFLIENEEVIERWSGLGLVVFGLAYAAWAWKRHQSCVGHTHHGPKPGPTRRPYVFLFVLGFSPCVAALPMFFAAAPKGGLAVLLTLSSFTLGVLLALGSAAVLVRRGLMKLDHPLLEHWGEVIAGLVIALVGVAVFSA
jgi:cytochrome c biogenesis protein CcdA